MELETNEHRSVFDFRNHQETPTWNGLDGLEAVAVVFRSEWYLPGGPIVTTDPTLHVIIIPGVAQILKLFFGAPRVTQK